jgi:hypothetical protein
VDRHELGNYFKWEAVPGCPISFLHYPNYPFDLGYVLVGTCQIDHGATWHILNQGLQRRESAVGVHRLDVETTLEIILIHLFKSLEYLRYRAIREMIDCCEADLTNVEVPIVLNDSQKTHFSNEWRTYRERNDNLIKHQGQAFSLIQGQCTQLLQDEMKQDTDWAVVSTSYDPLTIYRLIERTILAQTEDQYPFSTVYDQEFSFYLFKQETLSNHQWYEIFNTKVDVSEAIGVTGQHKVLLDYVAQESYTKSFEGLEVAEQKLVIDNTEEQYVSYAFLRQIGIQHGNIKVDLQNDFTTGDNRYPKNRQQTLHLLDKYSKTVVPKVTQSEGTSFAQKIGRGSGRSYNGNGKGHESSTYDKKYWKDKEYCKFHKMGHPATHCGKKSNSNDDDDSSAAATFNSVKKLQKDIKSMRKAFMSVNTQLEKLKEAESDIYESEGEDEASYFQMNAALQFAQVEKEFEPRIAKLFKQAGLSVKIDLRKIILLDSQSAMDIFSNADLVTNTCKYTTSMRLKRNGGNMVVARKATMPGYNKDVWFSTRAITNIITLSNLIQQYRVTYDSDDKMCVVHRESQGKPNMEFRMHKCG